MKVSRSLRLMRGATIRTRKLARDMLVYWKRLEKEMVNSFLKFLNVSGLLVNTLPEV